MSIGYTDPMLPIRVEPVPGCPVCGSAGPVAYAELADRHHHVPGEWSFHRCPVDGTLWLSPRPVDEELPRCYPGAYFTHAATPSRTSRSRVAKALLRQIGLSALYGYHHLYPVTPINSALLRPLFLLPPIRAIVEDSLGACMLPYRPGGRLLDVGCGNGEYLVRMRQYGWEVAGIEPDAGAARIAREEHGLTVFAGPPEEAPFPEATFDSVTCRHVIEHVGASRLFLETVSRFLKPGGTLILSTPNADSLGHRRFGRDCYSLDPPRHLALYTPAGLRRLLATMPGLQLVRLATPARQARKVFSQWRIVRRHDAFRAPEARPKLGEQMVGWLFGALEGALAPLLPVGEEIELVLVKSQGDRKEA